MSTQPVRQIRSGIFGRQCEWCALFFYGDHDRDECQRAFVLQIRAIQRLVKEK